MIKHWLSGVLALVLLAGCAQTSSERDVPLVDTPQLGKFIWHDLITDDVAGAKRFYGPLFGWTFEDTTRETGEPYTLILADGRYVGGMVELADPGDGQDYTRWLGYYAVPDVDAAAKDTTEAGGSVEVAPVDLGSLARAAAIRDPEGAVVGLIDSRVGYPDGTFDRGVGHVAWNELLAADASRAGRFYADLVGGRLVEEDRGTGIYRTLERDGLARAGIMQRPADEVEPLWLTYFAVKDPSASANAAAAAGGEVILPPLPDVREGSIAIITDPAGAVLALQATP